MPNFLTNELWDENNRYTIEQMNALYQSYYNNDDQLRNLVDSLFTIYVNVAMPVGHQLKNPQQLQDAIDRLYALEYLLPPGSSPTPPQPRDTPLPSSAYDVPYDVRYYGEIKALLEEQPFQALLEGVQFNPKAHLPLLRMFRVLRGLLFWVEDGPNYDVDPVFVTDADGYYTTLKIFDADTQQDLYLVVDGDGNPVFDVNDNPILRPLPTPSGIQPISLMEFWIKRIKAAHLRTLYRISNFEAGIRDRPVTDGVWPSLPWNTFSWVHDDGPASIAYTNQKFAPVVIAGMNQHLLSGVLETTLHGDAADNDGNSITYLWEVIDGPDPLDYPVIVSPNSAVTDIQFVSGGTFTIRLTATNAHGSNSDTVQVRYDLFPSSFADAKYYFTNVAYGNGNLDNATIRYNASGQQWEVEGHGSGSGGGVASLRYFLGDFDVIMRVDQFNSTSNGRECGIIASLTTDSDTDRQYLFMGVERSGSNSTFRFRSSNRNVYAGGISNTTQGSGLNAGWFRLRRIGDTLQSLYSFDGITWSIIHNNTMALGGTPLYLGFWGRSNVDCVFHEVTGLVTHINPAPPKCYAGIDHFSVWDESMTIEGAVASDGLSGPPKIQWLQLSPVDVKMMEPYQSTMVVEAWKAIGDHVFILQATDPIGRSHQSNITVGVTAVHDGQRVRYPQRFPAGFIKGGEYQYFREDVSKYAFNTDITLLAQGNVNNELLMEESYVMTPIGVIRVPRCLVSWNDLANIQNIESFDNPIVFVGLEIETGLAKVDAQQTQGMALPDTVDTNGFDSPITLLEKYDAGDTFTNRPATLQGPQRNALKSLGAWGQNHGTLIGHVHASTLSSDVTQQYMQVTVKPVVQVFEANDFFLYLRNTLVTNTNDEIADINANSTPLDQAPFTTVGLTSRHVIKFLESNGYFPDYTHDTDQAVLWKANPDYILGPDPFASNRSLSYIMPMLIQLEKNPSGFNIDNLNGSENTFNSGWAIRRVSSIIKSQSAIFFDDGTGGIDIFPNDFVGSDVTVWKRDGSSFKTSIVQRVGDSLARVDADTIDDIEIGDILTMNSRVAPISLEKVYRKEANKLTIVDIRTRPVRLVEPEVDTPADVSPLPSPVYSPFPWEASPNNWFTLNRNNPRSLQHGMVASIYDTMFTAIESKLRFHLIQRYFNKVSNRWNVADLRVDADDLKDFLIAWVENFTPDPDSWFSQDGVLIHWPDKQEELTGKRETRIALDRYPQRRIFDREDEIVIADSQSEWGDVPFLIRHWQSTDHIRYPKQVEDTLSFVSERAFTIPGHQSLNGTFFFDPEDGWIVNPIFKISLYQNKMQNDGTTNRVFLGDIEFDNRFPTSFRSATGVFVIDGDANYNPVTRRVSINYGETINFSSDEPGEVVVAYVYNDLTNVHPLFQFIPAEYGLTLSHLHDTEVFKVSGGEEEPIMVAGEDTGNGEEPEEKELFLRLEGISNIGGVYTIRWDRDDINALIAELGFIRSWWVIRGIPWIEIKEVTYNEFGQAIDVEYEAHWINLEPTVTGTIDEDHRNQQWYLPCSLKYGWNNITQSNIHTESTPLFFPPRFIFYEKQDFLVNGALNAARTARSINYTYQAQEVDYRWTKTITVPVSMPSSYMTYITSVAVLRNFKTHERRAVSGIFTDGENQGSTVALNDEIDLDNLHQQSALYVRLQEWMSTDWVLEFAGAVVAITDTNSGTTDDGQTKLATVGYWYAGHDLEIIQPLGQSFGVDAWTFQFGSLNRDLSWWRMGDMPFAHIYRNNSILDIYRSNLIEGEPPYTNDAPCDLQQMIINDNPAYYYPMNVLDGSLEQPDFSGNNLDATFSNPAEFQSVSGLINPNNAALDRSILFNPTGATHGLDLPNSPLINADAAGYTQKTWEMWIMLDDLSAEQTLIKHGDTTHGMSIYIRNGKVTTTIHRDSNTYQTNLDVENIQPNTIYHLVITYDLINHAVKCFVNGFLRFVEPIDPDFTILPAHQPTGNHNAIARNRNGLRRTGGTWGGTNRPLVNGRLDHLAHYNYILSDQTIMNHYLAGLCIQ